ncbi:TRAP transporter large permease [Anaerotruncus rubiinfantis]|uniref:TRAP transporter large permease n=1 Tax=Anaerotruncus rubiinfantis TaxID=1720200 RepID=UPI0034A20E84
MTNIIISIIILLILLLLGLALPLVFFAATIFMILSSGSDPSFVIPYGYGKINSLTILVVPLFMIAGAFMEQSGIGDKLLTASERLVGSKVKGGIGVACCIACAIFGAISGSANAALTTLSPICYPKLYARGYHKGEACSLLASASILGCLIPPSGMMILYAWVTNTSVLACFLSTLAPGLLLTAIFSIINLFMARKMGVTSLGEDIQVFYPEKKDKMDLSIFWALFMPVFVLGTIYGGIMTPTEAAAASAFYAFVVGFFIYKKLDRQNIVGLLAKSGKQAGVVMLLIFSVTILSRLYIDAGMPKAVFQLLSSITNNKVVMLLFINLFLVFIGMLMDDASGIVLAAPLLAPVIQELGVDMVHFAAIVGVNLGMGAITPPTAPMTYLAGKLGGGTFAEMLVPTLKFILFGWLPVLLFTTYCEDFALFFPRLILGY